MANVVGVEPSDIEVGMPVEVEWVDHDLDADPPGLPASSDPVGSA